MNSKRGFRTTLTLMVLTSIVLSLFFFGSVLPARADGEVTPPPPGEGVIIDPNIVGGLPADPGEWPWQVALIQGGMTDYYNGQFCGGSLLAPDWVVTAAHCVYGDPISAVDVVAGVYDLAFPSGSQKRDVAQIIVHPSYSPSTHNNDVALLRLSQPVTIGGTGSTKTGLISLVSASVGDLTGVNSWVTGWGATEGQPNYPTELREVQVPIIANSLCNDANHYNGDITSNMMCAGFEQGGKDSCQGDSGGPLVVDTGSGWRLAGIVSWGVGCADAGNYGVYTRVSQFVSWINTYVDTGTSDTTLTALSGGAQDGWLLESGENTGVGGKGNASATTVMVGDDAANRQYRSILSFNTASLPDNAQITSVTLRLRFGGTAGTNPFNTHGSLVVDIRNGAFADNAALQLDDFAAPSGGDAVMSIANSLTSGWYSATLPSGNFSLINLTGVTQLRLRFATDDNNDAGADVLKLYSGNAPTSYRPQLIIVYTVP